MIRRQLIPAISTFASTVALGLLADCYVKPLYRAEGKLLIDRIPASKTTATITNSGLNSNSKSRDLK
jgi:uncharacterized protein involved in exopolysaccharide biosynthesis